MTTPSYGLLTELLFLSEKKEKALNLVKMLDYGMMPNPIRIGQMMPIQSMTNDMFIAALSNAAQSDQLKRSSGAFSTAIIDFGDGPAECVIKVGMGGDKAFNYLHYCKEKGGRSFCTAFPDVYYLDSMDIKDGTVNVAIMEYVDMHSSQQNAADFLITKLQRRLRDILDSYIVNAEQVRKQLEKMLASAEFGQIHDVLGWSTEDVIRFFQTLYEIGGTIDLHDGNFGFRKDNTVCVFDPLSFTW